ncbi:MAG TPA: hypothetical protein VMT64_15925 [Candidatus Binataceae bacterium]|nr:hypothetical protein [Candidatus Binataceae bacterium]
MAASMKHQVRSQAPSKRDFLDMSSITKAELDGLLALATRIKAELKAGLEHPYLRGKTLAMIFQKPSLRTRITFETGMAQLGGHAIYLAPNDIGIGERESVKDVARNMAHSWIEAAALAGFELRLACPKGYEPDKQFMQMFRRAECGILTNDPIEAVKGADVVYTDTWTSMGREKEAAQRRKDFKGFQVNAALIKQATPGAIVMHCLPAHRGEEITDDVIDGPRSAVLDEAENRLHAQKAVMVWLLRPEVLQIASAQD